jgi:hypothetical protein
MNYVTVESVTLKLGPNWWGTGDPNLAVIQANAWLNARNLPEYPEGEVPDAILTAGAYLAKLAATGQLYTTKEGVVASKTVSAQSGTSVSKTYVSGKEESISGDMQFILDLLGPFMGEKYHINTYVITE